LNIITLYITTTESITKGYLAVSFKILP